MLRNLGDPTSRDPESKGSSIAIKRFLRPSYAPGLAKTSGSTVVCRVLIISKLRAAGSGLSGKMTVIDGDQRCTGVERIMLTHYGWQNQRRTNSVHFTLVRREVHTVVMVYSALVELGSEMVGVYLDHLASGPMSRTFYTDRCDMRRRSQGTSDSRPTSAAESTTARGRGASAEWAAPA